MTTSQQAIGIDLPAAALRVLVVDDHRVFSDLVAMAMSIQPGLTCIGTASGAAEGVAMAAQLRPDIVVMDIEMPRQSGIAATRRILELVPDAVVVVVSAHQSPHWVVKAAQAGASAFVCKDGSFVELIDTLRRVRKGSMLVAPSTYQSGPPVQDRRDAVAPPALTPREHDVLVCLGKGLPMAAIAATLGITVHTSRGYTKALMAKLGVHSQLEAVVKAQHLGLLDPSDG